MARPGSTTSETGNNYNTANGTGAAVRTKLNEIFTALRTLSSGRASASLTFSHYNNVPKNIADDIEAMEWNGKKDKKYKKITGQS